LHLRDETYIVPIAMYDMNTRAKRIKNYERDLCFLDAVQRNTCKGIIIDTNRIDDNIKIKIYIPTWKKCVSVVYMYDEVVWSRDETREIDVTLFRDVIVTFTFNLNGRNWKERAIINI
jgi:hypothetical protein